MLKEKNMRVGNRHLASKIIAMQDAAKSHDNVLSEHAPRSIAKLNSVLDIVSEKSGNDISIDEDDATSSSAAVIVVPVKIKRHSVSFAAETDKSNVIDNNDDNITCSSSSSSNTGSKIVEIKSTESPIPLRSKDDQTDSPPSDRNGRHLKSGHAKTHAIVINLDDKSRFAEEVTV